ncbi:MAG: SDR family NAD(P)-dependent oxidoreductase, partial [Actinomycetota bacterium]
MTGRLDGKVALITGAGSGMGREAAALFAAEGARVVVVDVVAEAAAAVADSVRAAGGTASAFTADVSAAADCDAMVAHATSTHGGLHVLYNNAGVFPADDGGVLETPET